MCEDLGLHFQLITSCKQSRDIICYTSAIITINRCDVDMMFTCTILHCELYNSVDIYIGPIDFRMYLP